MDLDSLGRQFILMPMHMVCMYYLLRQMVYTDAHAYTVHVVLCVFLDVAVFVYVLTYIFFNQV